MGSNGKTTASVALPSGRVAPLYPSSSAELHVLGDRCSSCGRHFCGACEGQLLPLAVCGRCLLSWREAQ